MFTQNNYYDIHIKDATFKVRTPMGSLCGKVE